MRIAASFALPLLAVVAFAQENPPQTPPQQSTPPAQQQQQKQTPPADMTDPQHPGPAAQATPAPNGKLPEMKTQKYSGDLVDASCAGAGAPAASATADRSADQSAGCALSSSTSQFALKMKDGQTVKFDSVGNGRAQMAIKDKKKWADAAGAGKMIHVSVSGVMSGDQLTVVSIN